MIQYSSNEGDLVADFFLGGFSTARAAIGLNRRAVGFEISGRIYDTKIREMATITPGYLLPTLRIPAIKGTRNLGKSWTEADRTRLTRHFEALRAQGRSKKECIAALGEEFGRGRWGIEKALKKYAPEKTSRRGFKNH